ncbi:L,D-transpeptidase [Demequina lutea]|uniref:Lipoprotein-anchoring transpeptidase ErfK/SrfK n=1 Tax=Demequina lutea TaxID=431489 RepID=A0A7Y9Z8D3_9MICO|nr:L,D-transpeptidase [Demequina lutea]NYI40707.1 lipoprotein-anchoring transpeptidase ErfK/SrfK [Demequina lutea]
MKPRFTQGRSRWLAGGGAALLVVVSVAAALFALASPGNPAPAAPPTAAAVPAITATGLAPLEAPSINSGIAPGKAILTSTVGTLDVFDAPGGTVTRGLSRYTYYSSPLTLMAIDKGEADGDTWYQVLLPGKPNGQTGWVRASDVTVSSTDTVIHVYLAEHELDLVVDGTVAMTAPVAVGAPATPTPLGTFYITDSIDLSTNPSGVYGSYALGLSGYSEALDSFKGTLPQIAIHGTYLPESVGKSVSNGCIRMRNDAVHNLAARVGLGTPVIVSASRVAA